jgi:uncharacterized membrane protein YqjE
MMTNICFVFIAMTLMGYIKRCKEVIDLEYKMNSKVLVYLVLYVF